ncbi:SWI/SNF-related matrix-associated actin-dependent regulator of chromatin subfamily A-like protein 1 [Temnothorax curvispinosus]|uniref:SWI/SNF-related matrix-associated actin-dependent regulator of chromatin subfamily A-like protein 1 n=1 Tax=Temnothorax curvispinosus TaxID=300111 RepID=A0A6J1QAD8_9HYME|nr:SWI/SNF-related matrix-associated actin-dependent regulator of chromatin subfamily A-like protein 1 [Temnothorax curvispinosus]
MDKKCTPEEIEKKRLLALQRRQEAQLKAQILSKDSPARQQTHLSDSTNVVRLNKSNVRFNPIEPRNFFSQASNVTGKCYMISQDRFAVELSAFVPEIVEIFKTVPSRVYDLKTRIWNFHLNDYDGLLQKLTSNNCNITVTRIPEAVFQIFKRNLKLDNQVKSEQDLSKIDKKLLDTLMPFQRDGICYGISKNGRCMIADDMGLGKTIQALGIAHYFKDSWPLLIVAPSSVKFQWSEAIYEFLPSIPTHYIHHFASTKDRIEDDKITITSYDLLARNVHVFERHIYGFVILDESHVLKSTKTARFQAAQRICAHARHIVLLTGTPALSRPSELYSQISLITTRFLSYDDYGMRYCGGQRDVYSWEYTGCSNMQELQSLLKVNCMIRRMKTDVLHQLPSKMRQVIILDSDLIKTGKQMKEMSRKMEKTATALERHTTLLQYYTESSFARLKAVRKYVANLFENKKKCLLYAHHQNVLAAICEVAKSMNVRYIRIDGKTSPEQRKLQVDLFQERDDYMAAVLSITAANAGITLTAAHLVVFAELFWNPGILCQAEDRVHRIGQNDTVVIQYLVARNTADDYIWPLINKKMNVLNSVGLKQDFSISNIDVAMLEETQPSLTSFLNRCSASEGSQRDKDLQEAQEASTSSDFKELLDVDEECFDSCAWDNIA